MAKLKSETKTASRKPTKKSGSTDKEIASKGKPQTPKGPKKSAKKMTKKTSDKKVDEFGKQMSVESKVKEHIIYEIKFLCLVAFTIISMLSIMTDLVGVVGTFIKEVYLGLFSFTGAVIPLILFVIILVLINKKVRNKRRFIVATVFITLSLLLFFATVSYKLMMSYINNNGISMLSLKFISVSFNEGIEFGGSGVIGNIIGYTMIKLVGVPGTYIISALLFLMSLVLIFQISISDLVTHSGKKAVTGVVPLRVKLVALIKKIFTKREKEESEDAHFDNLDDLEGDLPVVSSAETGADFNSFNFDYVNSEALVAEEINSETESTAEVKKESVKEVVEDVIVEKETAQPSLGNDEKIEKPLATEETKEKKDHLSESPHLNQYLVNIAGLPKEAEEVIVEEPTVPFVAEVVEEPEVIVEEYTKPVLKEVIVEEEPEVVVNVDTKVNEQVTISIPKKVAYKIPTLDLLNNYDTNIKEDPKTVENKGKLLESTLKNFGVDAKVTKAHIGPTITMFELQLSPGVKVSKISNLSDDIGLALASPSVNILAPIPGTSAVGVEIPNTVTSMVSFKEVINSSEFRGVKSKITFGLGKDISGKALVHDLGKMPHLLIAGATGSGKSVCVNTIVNSILFNATPDEVKILMIDPKVVELSIYNGIPHLVLPVVTDPKLASVALNWAVNEMDNRYQQFSEKGVKDIAGFNTKAEKDPETKKMQSIVVIIDELADLMMVAPNQVEEAICRLAQKARACGIHLIVATQRPSVDVITGLIKANIPSRIAFSVSSQTDSRTILDGGGAEKLLGRGDMLFFPVGVPKPIRIQGAFVSDEEVERIVDFIKNQDIEIEYNEEVISEKAVSATSGPADSGDELLNDVMYYFIDLGEASISKVQRKFRVGYNRAARIVDLAEDRGLIGPSQGSKAREVLVTKEEFEESLSGC